MNRKELDGLLGMYEMEAALEWMLRKAEAAGVPFSKLDFTPRDLPRGQDDYNQIEMVGFCHLVQRDLMYSFYPHSVWRPTAGFVSLLRERRQCFRDLPDPPTTEEIIDKLVPRAPT